MQIDRQQIVDLLRQRGDEDKATQAESALPEQLDTDKDKDKLSQLGLNPQDLMGSGGGGGMGNPLGS
ncbi:hypothetical protein N802_16365 [Knoellia sinensis KCTC 19936]|uniref:Uncharacterized protein n=1 Tax=Knoellia sinensis KCTC 19936 TaxID=1385520 RepID=A0A0A0JBG3_9MICO|nr:hypothetical protein [Knoellia sinensis]KGN32951.1 hypothetical protein N802_16365 [Knoellia sinensis KCTC 19936]